VLGLFLAWSGLGAPRSIPEPGLLLFGQVLGVDPGTLEPGALRWTNRLGADVVFVEAKWLVVNGQVFYVAQVPFETRRILGPAVIELQPDPGTLELTETPSTLTRSASLNGQPLALRDPGQGTTTFGAADRGRTDRVDLTLQVFDAWISGFPQVPVDQRGRAADPDGDGATNEEEFVAGTSPSDKASVFRALDPEVTGHSFSLVWHAVAGKTYVVRRAAALGEPESFVVVSRRTAVVAGPMSFTDPTPLTGQAIIFYRVEVTP